MYYIQNKNKEVTILQLLIMPGLQVSEFYDNSLIVNEHGRSSTHVGSGSIDSVPLTVRGVVRFRCCLYEQIITNLRPEKNAFPFHYDWDLFISLSEWNVRQITIQYRARSVGTRDKTKQIKNKLKVTFPNVILNVCRKRTSQHNPQTIPVSSADASD